MLTLLVVVAYSTNIIPPLPLALKEGGVYHSITHTGDSYVAKGEPQRAWWDYRPETIHHVPGTPLYAFSAVYAPTTFSTGVEHVWQEYDDQSSSWVTRATIAFNVSGGREEGYRGYSLKSNVDPGKCGY